MKPILKAAVGLVGVVLLVFDAGAQLPQVFSGRLVTSLLTNIFVQSTAFTTMAQIQVDDTQGTASIPAGLVRLNNNFRIFLDFSQAHGGSFTPDVINAWKASGMDKAVYIINGERGSIIVMFPGLQGYYETTLLFDAPDLQKPPADMVVERSDAGTETVDGRSCTKTKLVTVAKGEKKDAGFVWVASNQTNFPYKVSLKLWDESPLVAKFSQWKTNAPDASLFDAPAGFTRYPNEAALLQAAASRPPQAQAQQQPAQPARQPAVTTARPAPAQQQVRPAPPAGGRGQPAQGGRGGGGRGGRGGGGGRRGG